MTSTFSGTDRSRNNPDSAAVGPVQRQGGVFLFHRTKLGNKFRMMTHNCGVFQQFSSQHDHQISPQQSISALMSRFLRMFLDHTDWKINGNQSHMESSANSTVQCLI
ncbi:hypothetical protein TNCV_442531 [Trichonephila clavipes]|nr:hypothetical protein TNCV_442531 [Trichonephila clavipes]